METEGGRLTPSNLCRGRISVQGKEKERGGDAPKGKQGAVSPHPAQVFSVEGAGMCFRERGGIIFAIVEVMQGGK